MLNQCGRQKQVGGLLLCMWGSGSSGMLCWYLRGWRPLRHNEGHTASQSDDNPAVCIKGFVLVGLAADPPEVATLFIFPLS